MPVYDYRCASCGRRYALFFRSFSEVGEARCPHCGSAEASRLPPRVGVLRSEESRLEDLGDPSSLGDVDERDPRSVARWAKKLAGTMGEDLGDELDAAMEGVAAGEEGGGEGAAAAPDDGADDAA